MGTAAETGFGGGFHGRCSIYPTHGQHGWWQGCAELDEPGYDPFGPEGANLNLIVSSDAADPVSGSVPHRSYLCEIRMARSFESSRRTGELANETHAGWPHAFRLRRRESGPD
ncbi:MAG: hypothetical protein R2855_02870 [Thermomicrobiales bacterium]